MNAKKLNIILTCLLTISLIAISFLMGKEYSNDKKTDITKPNTYSTKASEAKIEESHVIEESVTDKQEDLNTTTEVKPVEQTITYTKTDNTVIEELNVIDTETEKTLNYEDESVALEKAKGIFVKLVDFAFYDGEIKGHTFKELSNDGKEKVLAIINSLDKKIDNKFPGYKDSISKTAGSALEKASEIISKGASNIADFSREKLGEENYQSILDAKDEMINYYKETSEIVKDKGSSIYSKAKDKIKEWYENFRKN